VGDRGGGGRHRGSVVCAASAGAVVAGIDLNHASLKGTLPAASLLAHLTFIHLNSNRLTGVVPDTLWNLQYLTELDLSNNLLSGHLPSMLSCLFGIEVLNNAHNQLTGELMELVCDLRRIMNLSVAFNFFSEISQDCDRLAGRSMFNFAGNCVPGRDMQRPQPKCDGARGDAAGLVSASAVQGHAAVDLLVLGLVHFGRETKIYKVAKICVFICFLIQGNRESANC
jgi:hypothetical protein